MLLGPERGPSLSGVVLSSGKASVAVIFIGGKIKGCAYDHRRDDPMLTRKEKSIIEGRVGYSTGGGVVQRI
jgi:hypothetical protein